MKVSLRPRAHRGAALVEFALVLPLLFLVIATVWEWSGIVREANILIEATRHGARVIGGMSADVDRGAEWCTAGAIQPYESGFQNCGGAISASGLSPWPTLEADAVSAMGSVCQYLDVAGVGRANWDVQLQLLEADPKIREPGGLAAWAFRMSVQRSVTATRPCLICLLHFFGNSLRNEGQSVFPMQTRCP